MNCRQASSPTGPKTAAADLKNLSGLLSPSEMGFVSLLLKSGLQCMTVYRADLMGGLFLPEEKQQTGEKEVLEHFAGIFTVLDPHDFTDLTRENFGFIYANILRHPPVIAFAKALMKNVNVSRYFVTVAMKHVNDNIYRLAGQHAPIPSQYKEEPEEFNATLAPNRTWSFEGVPFAGKDAVSNV